MRRQITALLMMGAAAAAVYGQESANEADELGQQLIRLRGEIEMLNTELDGMRDEHRAQIVALNQQSVQLEAELSRRQLEISQLTEQLNKAVAEAEAAGSDDQLIKPQVLAAVEALRAQVEAGIPFKTVERIQELDEIRRQVEAGTLSPGRATNRLWAFTEDELRLTRENGIYSQTIGLGNENVLADVAKLGTMFLYFQLPDGRVGLARRTGTNWRYVAVTEATEVAQIRELFDSLRKQIRQGYFELPNPFAS